MGQTLLEREDVLDWEALHAPNRLGSRRCTGVSRRVSAAVSRGSGFWRT